MEHISKEVQSLHSKFGGNDEMEKLLDKEKNQFRDMWSEGLWRTKFPGRKILRRFCDKLDRDIDYISLRNAIVGEMAKSEYKPEGMANIISKIEEA